MYLLFHITKNKKRVKSMRETYLFNRKKFKDNEIEDLMNVIRENEDVDLECNKEIAGIWIASSHFEVELRLSFLGDFGLIISRVRFINKRKGTMGAILKYLIEYCKENSIHFIIAQSVLTKEMASFCLKHGFKPEPYSSLDAGEFIIGNYRLEIN